jgi:hypothetical protein
MPEKNFDLPMLTINLRDSRGSKIQAVGKQHQHLLMLFAPDLEAAQE